MEETKIIEEVIKKKIKEVKETKNEEIKIKPTIEFKNMTSRQIIDVTGKPKEGFHNKRELCSLLEKQGYKIKY